MQYNVIIKKYRTAVRSLLDDPAIGIRSSRTICPTEGDTGQNGPATQHGAHQMQVSSMTSSAITATALRLLASKRPEMTLDAAIEAIVFIAQEAPNVSEDANGLIEQQALAILGTAIALEKLPPWN